MMKETKKCHEVLSHLTKGKVYHWRELKKYSSSMGRDVNQLLDANLLKKVGPGIYVRPKFSRWGELPPSAHELAEKFLNTKDFLMVSPNLYNSLGVGLTQLKTETWVYNRKRHSEVKLSGQTYQFKRPNNGYPRKLSQEFLLVDLLNNLKSTGEDPDEVLRHVERKLADDDCQFNKTLLKTLCSKYGKVGTKKFLNQLLKQ